MSRASWKVPCLALVLALCGCEELEDPSFDLDCAGGRCAWELDEGRTRKVSTWNEYDQGLEFLDTPTVVSQRVDGSLDCGLDVKVFGKIEKGADFSVGIDADDDGEVDDEAQISELDWDDTHVFLAADAEDSWRLILTKRGSGKVVLGTVSAERRCE